MIISNLLLLQMLLMSLEAFMNKASNSSTSTYDLEHLKEVTQRNPQTRDFWSLPTFGSTVSLSFSTRKQIRHGITLSFDAGMRASECCMCRTIYSTAINRTNRWPTQHRWPHFELSRSLLWCSISSQKHFQFIDSDSDIFFTVQNANYLKYLHKMVTTEFRNNKKIDDETNIRY